MDALPDLVRHAIGYLSALPLEIVLTPALIAALLFTGGGHRL